MSERKPPIHMYTTNWCADTWRVRQLLQDYAVPFTETDIDTDPAAAALVRRLNNGRVVVPTLILPDGAVLAEPSNAILLARLGLEADVW